MIVLFDTCVILDYLLDRTPYADDAEELMIRVSAEEIKGLITVKSLMDIHYVVTFSVIELPSMELLVLCPVRQLTGEQPQS